MGDDNFSIRTKVTSKKGGHLHVIQTFLDDDIDTPDDYDRHPFWITIHYVFVTEEGGDLLQSEEKYYHEMFHDALAKHSDLIYRIRALNE